MKILQEDIIKLSKEFKTKVNLQKNQPGLKSIEELQTELTNGVEEFEFVLPPDD